MKAKMRNNMESDVATAVEDDTIRDISGIGEKRADSIMKIVRKYSQK